MLAEPVASRWVALILGCLHREYPYHLVHVVAGPDDVRTPRELTPAFFGCFDWHSAVHGHWSLVRLRRMFPAAEWVEAVDQALSRSLTVETLAAEIAYQRPAHRAGFERPYGLAWVLQLAAELRQTHSSLADVVRPLEALAVERLSWWLPRVPYPIRSGEHSQTAFAMGLCLDWARTAEDRAFESLLIDRAQAWYAADRNAPVAYEPSGHDFLSPALAEADLMRRVLAGSAYRDWLSGFLPGLADGWGPPAVSPDPADGKLAHLDGLNLSRAWMLRGIASALDDQDPRQAALHRAASDHAAAGLSAITGEHYSGTHWLCTFGVYLLSDAWKSGR